jgi:hypothetical protein
MTTRTLTDLAFDLEGFDVDAPGLVKLDSFYRLLGKALSLVKKKVSLLAAINRRRTYDVGVKDGHDGLLLFSPPPCLFFFSPAFFFSPTLPLSVSSTSRRGRRVRLLSGHAW